MNRYTQSDSITQSSRENRDFYTTGAAYEWVSGLKWLSTRERLHNYHTGFSGMPDFMEKITGLISHLDHTYRSQINSLTNEHAGLLARLCADHVIEVISLGLLKDNLPSLSTDLFIDKTKQWLMYIPMDTPQPLQRTDGSFIPSDTLIRGAGLVCKYGKHDLHFQWSPFPLTLFGKAAQLKGPKTHTFRHDVHRSGYRPAEAFEVDKLIGQLNEAIPDTAIEHKIDEIMASPQFSRHHRASHSTAFQIRMEQDRYYGHAVCMDCNIARCS